MRLEHLLSGAAARKVCVPHGVRHTGNQSPRCLLGSVSSCPRKKSGGREVPYGGLAQLARAPALQAGGQRFESVILHIFPARPSGGLRGKSIFDLLAHKTVVKTKVKKIKAIRIKRAVTARGRRYAIRRSYHIQQCKDMQRQCERSMSRRTVDALAHGGDEGRDKLR